MIPILIAAAFSGAIAGCDWGGFSIQVQSRHSSEMSQRYFHSEQESRLDTNLVGDRYNRVCFPVPSLPKEVWDKQDEIDLRKKQRLYADCKTMADKSWNNDGKQASLAECEKIRPAN